MAGNGKAGRLVVVLYGDTWHADEDAARDRDHAVADQRERVRVGTERDDRRVAGEVPDHVGEHGPVERLQLVKERIDQQELRLVHARDREPDLPRDELRRGADRDVGPWRESEPVEYRGHQQMPVSSWRARLPCRAVDERPDPRRAYRPRSRAAGD